MNLDWIKNIGLIIMLCIFTSSAAMASDRLNGQHIKEQAHRYFLKQGLNLSLIISDKRSFFPCSVPLKFHQKYEIFRSSPYPITVHRCARICSPKSQDQVLQLWTSFLLLPLDITLDITPVKIKNLNSSRSFVHASFCFTASVLTLTSLEFQSEIPSQ